MSHRLPTQSKSPTGIQIAVDPETEQHRHGNEITAVERRKKMAKEVGSRGVETKENERSSKKW